MKTENNASKTLFAIILIVVGSLFFLDNFSYIDLNQFPDIISYKLIFVLIAFNSFSKSKILSGSIWTIVALCLYFPELLTVFNVDNLFSLWPLLLIGIGIKKIYNSQNTAI